MGMVSARRAARMLDNRLTYDMIGIEFAEDCRCANALKGRLHER